MRLWRRRVTVPEAETGPPVLDLRAEMGSDWCSSRGCVQKTGLACEYVDRKGRCCPTSWCPDHRHVDLGRIYCPGHGSFVTGSRDEFGERVRIDVENRVPLLVAWASQEVHAEVEELIQAIAVERHETLVRDPVHYSLVGSRRIRTWERAWKIVDGRGIVLRLAIAVEEADPMVVEVRLNSNAVVRLVAPWAEEHDMGDIPESADQAHRLQRRFIHALLVALEEAVALWRENQTLRDRDQSYAPRVLTTVPGPRLFAEDRAMSKEALIGRAFARDGVGDGSENPEERAPLTESASRALSLVMAAIADDGEGFLGAE